MRCELQQINQQCFAALDNVEDTATTESGRVPGHLTLANKKLHVLCKYCGEEVNFKNSRIKNHVQSTKHTDSKAKLQEKGTL